MSGKVKEVAVEEAERIKTLTSDAVRSGAYLYPFKVSKSLLFFSFLHSPPPQSLEGVVGIWHLKPLKLSKKKKKRSPGNIIMAS